MPDVMSLFGPSVVQLEVAVTSFHPLLNICYKKYDFTTLLSTSLGKMFFAWRFILNENTFVFCSE